MVNPCKNKLLALHLQSISFGEERIATLAQLVEQRIRNAQVEGSNPLSGSKKIRRKDFRLIFCFVEDFRGQIPFRRRSVLDALD